MLNSSAVTVKLAPPLGMTWSLNWRPWDELDVEVEVEMESKDMLDEDDEDVVGLTDVLDCEVSVTNAIVATIRMMTTTTTVTVVPIPLRLGIKAIRPPRCVL
jgi:hypothetical protein